MKSIQTAPDGSLRKMAEALLMSTAEPVDGSASDVEASPRQQGSGPGECVVRRYL